MILRTSLASLAVTLAPTAQELPEPFTWEVDLAAATAAAERTGKPIVAYFTYET